LALHPWDESIRMVAELAAENGIQLVTPFLGEEVIPGISATANWWEKPEGEGKDGLRAILYSSHLFPRKRYRKEQPCNMILVCSFTYLDWAAGLY
jgi:hypothetical protein